MKKLILLIVIALASCAKPKECVCRDGNSQVVSRDTFNGTTKEDEEQFETECKNKKVAASVSTNGQEGCKME